MNQATRQVLDEALDDEYKAQATYRAVLERFGSVRPFINIVESEGRHIDALLALYRQRGIKPPSDPWEGAVEAPQTVEEACRAAVEAEEENGAMYARLIAVTDDGEVQAVMRRLQDASQNNHLPAFKRCVERSKRGGRGRGRCRD